MSTLSKRMIQDMQLRGLSPCTQISCTRAIRQLAKHYRKAPDPITQGAVRPQKPHPSKHTIPPPEPVPAFSQRYRSAYPREHLP